MYHWNPMHARLLFGRICRHAALAGTCLLLSPRPVAAQPLMVAAASDLQSALPIIVSRFEQESGQRVALVLGSSGNLFTQIQNGAPFDVFLSADVDYPRRLEGAGQAERGSLYEYARGRLVLWTRKDSGIDVKRGLAVLAAPDVHRIAVANPEHAPYGRAAVAALRQQQLYDRVRGKFALGENITQAAQFAQSGNAEVGLLALAVALSPVLKSSGTWIEIPETFHPPIEQAAVVLTASPRKALGRRFVDYLRRPDIVQVLQAHGFEAPMAGAGSR